MEALFEIGGEKVTSRELLAVPTIIGVLVVVGFLIAGKIDETVQNVRLKYLSAPAVSTAEDFKNRLKTDNDWVFVSGNVSVVDPVHLYEINNWDHHEKNWIGFEKGNYLDPSLLPSDDYSQVSIVVEQYEEHVYYETDDEGHTNKRVRRDWERRGSNSKSSNTYLFNDCKFDSSKIDVYYPNVYSTIHYNGHSVGSYRFKINAWATNVNGVMFTFIENEDIKDHSEFINNEEMDIELIRDRFVNGFPWVIFFWINWSIVIIAASIGFVMIDNKWLE